MANIDAIANGLLAARKFFVVLDDTADNFFVRHNFFNVVRDEFAKFFANACKVDANIRGEVFKRRQVSSRNEFVDGKTFNHRLKNVTKSNASRALWRGSDAQQKCFRKRVQNFFVSVRQNVMALVANEKIGRRNFFNSFGKSLNAGDLNRLVKFHFVTCGDNSVWNLKVVESFRGLFNKLVPMYEKY